MPDQKIVEYIKSQLGVGVSQDIIRNSLIQNGWPSASIDLAFASLGGSAPVPTPGTVTENNSQLQTQSISPSPIRIGKFKASYRIVKESWSILMQDKEIIIFPVLSFITSLIALIVFGGVFYFIIMNANIKAFDNSSEFLGNVISYVILFAYYLLMFFIANYFLAGVYTIVYARLNGQNLSFKDGLRASNNNLGKIFIWSLVSATVGMVLQIISDKSKIVGKIVVSLIGAAWNIITYFSFPFLIIGQKSIKDSFKESASLIRRVWGETIIVNFGVGLFFGLLIFLGFALSLGIIILIPIKITIISVIILFVIYCIILSIISSTLSTIFKIALYEFAQTGKVVQGFTPEILKGAIKVK